MAANDALIAWVLDRSGSMDNVQQVTIDEFNRFMEEQASGQPGNCYLSLTLFDTTIEERFVAVDATTVPPMAKTGLNSYQTGGGTALRDAVGDTIRATQTWLAGQNPAFDGKVFLVILTDGQENSSQRWSWDEMNAAIKEAQEADWEVVYLGSGGAAWTEGQHMAAAGVSTVNFAGDRASTAQTYAGVSSSMTATRQHGASFTKSMADNTSHLNADPNLPGSGSSTSGAETPTP